MLLGFFSYTLFLATGSQFLFQAFSGSSTSILPLKASVSQRLVLLSLFILPTHPVQSPLSPKLYLQPGNCPDLSCLLHVGYLDILQAHHTQLFIWSFSPGPVPSFVFLALRMAQPEAFLLTPKTRSLLQLLSVPASIQTVIKSW